MGNVINSQVLAALSRSDLLRKTTLAAYSCCGSTKDTPKSGDLPTGFSHGGSFIFPHGPARIKILCLPVRRNTMMLTVLIRLPHLADELIPLSRFAITSKMVRPLQRHCLPDYYATCFTASPVVCSCRCERIPKPNLFLDDILTIGRTWVDSGLPPLFLSAVSFPRTVYAELQDSE